MADHSIPNPKPYPLLRKLIRFLFKVLFDFKATGQEHLPPKGPVLFAPNHVSYFDPILVAIGQDKPMNFMAWDALFSWPIGNWLIRKMGAFPVSLTQLDIGAYRKALKCLRQGKRLLIFPEGGRSPDGKIMEMREGVVHLSLTGRAPIIPVRIEGALEVWPKGKLFPRLFHPMRITYGPPILPPPPHLKDQERALATREILAQLQAFLEPVGKN